MANAILSTELVNQASAVQKFYEFLAKNPANFARVLGEPDVRVRVSTDDNTKFTVANLHDLGFEFPADTVRVVRTRAYARGDISNADVAYHETTTAVLGGAAPSVVEASILEEHGDSTYDGASNIEISSNEVIATVTGVTSVVTNWEVQIFLEAPVYISGGQA